MNKQCFTCKNPIVNGELYYTWDPEPRHLMCAFTELFTKTNELKHLLLELAQAIQEQHKSTQNLHGREEPKIVALITKIRNWL